MAEVQTTYQDTKINDKAVKLISFAGQLDETNVDEEAKKMYQVIDEMAEPNLLLDFAELSYMNSKSIGYVTDWYSRVAAKNGKIVIVNARPNILDILKVVGITQIINIYEKMEDAKAAFSGEGAEPAAEAPVEAPKAEAPVPAAPEPLAKEEAAPVTAETPPEPPAEKPAEEAPPTPPAAPPAA
jgi:anti-anti-sigma factor